MGHLTYLAVLAGCLACALVLEPLLRVNVLRRWRRLVLTLLPVAAVFVAWDVAAIRAGQWTYDPAQIVDVFLPGRLPLEELLFFLVVPACAILGFEAVRAVTGYPAGDEVASGARPGGPAGRTARRGDAVAGRGDPVAGRGDPVAGRGDAVGGGVAGVIADPPDQGAETADPR